MRVTRTSKFYMKKKTKNNNSDNIKDSKLEDIIEPTQHYNRKLQLDIIEEEKDLQNPKVLPSGKQSDL